MRKRGSNSIPSIEEVKRRYPPGTKYKCVNGNRAGWIEAVGYDNTHKDMGVHCSRHGTWYFLGGAWAEKEFEDSQYLIFN